MVNACLLRLTAAAGTIDSQDFVLSNHYFLDIGLFLPSIIDFITLHNPIGIWSYCP